MKHRTWLALASLALILVGWSTHAQTANPQASPAAKKVLKFLAELPQQPGHPLVSGQLIGTLDGLSGDTRADMTTGYTAYVEALESRTGKTVGLIGANFGRLQNCPTPNPLYPKGRSPFMHCDGSEPTFPADMTLLERHWAKGGLVSVTWQAQNPWTGGNAHDLKITGNFEDLTRPGSEIYPTWRKMLDEEAAVLSQLRDRGVVVLYRPFHEQNGNWFWWGNHGAGTTPTREEFAAVWRDMFVYFTKVKKLDNLLWVFAVNHLTPQEALMARDPGKDFYDIVGLDYYPGFSAGAPPGLAALLATGKPLALTEVGPSVSSLRHPRTSSTFDFCDILHIQKDFPHFSFFMAWFGVYEQQALVQSPCISSLLNNPEVLNLADPGLRPLSKK